MFSRLLDHVLKLMSFEASAPMAAHVLIYIASVDWWYIGIECFRGLQLLKLVFAICGQLDCWLKLVFTFVSIPIRPFM